MSAAEHFQAEYRRLRGRGPAWLQAGRDAAMAAFQVAGFPGPRQEDWKYTDVGPIARLKLEAGVPAGAEADPGDWRFPGLRTAELAFVNGSSAGPAAEVQAGVRLQPLAPALAEGSAFLRDHLTRLADVHRNPFIALNTAVMTDGAVLHVAEGTEAEVPLHLLFIAAPAGPLAVHPRNLIVLGANARATVLEHYAGADGSDYFTDCTTEIVLGPGAVLEHYRLQQEGDRGLHVGHTVVRQARDSRYVSHALALGARLARTDLDVQLAEPGAETVLNGLYLAGRRQHVDNHTRIDHLQARCRSEQHYRGILDGRARAVFNGKVVVHPDAQQTDARQANANLLLSDDAEVDTKPELEIYADDVKCSHGATVGRLDADMLFYLRSRAIPESVARSLLTFAFAGDLIGRIGIEPVRARVRNTVAGRLPDPDLISRFLQ